MPSKSYAVNSKVKLPQPHLDDYANAAPPIQTSWTPWCAFCLVGVGAVTFILCLYFLGGARVFLTAVKPFAGLVPIVRRGELKVYPDFPGSHNGVESRFFFNLSSVNLTEITDSLGHLFESYPKEHGSSYTNCWLENPTPNRPCFFDASWGADLCPSNFSYGYEEHGGGYDPCFVLVPEETQDWIPRLNENLPDHHDYGFVPVHCSVRRTSPKLPPQNMSPEESERNPSNVSLSIYPSKGFARQFFPASRFANSSAYLPPMVAVRVNGVRKGHTVLVRCSVITPNAFILNNTGTVSIRFSAD